MKFKTPLTLKPGDKVALISPSSGMPFPFPWVYKQLVPVEFSQNPEARAKDINEAFSDPPIYV